jgi:cell division protease FtsH
MSSGDDLAELDGSMETVGLRTYSTPPQSFLPGGTPNRIEASEATEREIDTAVRDSF